MVKVIDHSQTGKTKFIKGNGRKGDIPFELLDDHKNKEEIRADGLLEIVNTKEVENKKPYTNLEPSTIPHAVLIIADYQYKSAFVADQEINLVACLTELMSQVKFK